MAFNFFAFLEILSKCKQAFSKTYYIIFANWDNLLSDIVEKSETLNFGY